MNGEEAQMETLKNFGFYSMTLQWPNGTMMGDTLTKVISLNSNFCYQFNWEQTQLHEDPGNMLAWFEKELQFLENGGGQAILISHVPNLDECNR